MKKKVFITILCFMFLFSMFSFLYAGKGAEPPVEEEVKEKVEPPAKKIKNPDTIIYAKYGTIHSLDPHRAYDTASGEIVMNRVVA